MISTIRLCVTALLLGTAAAQAAPARFAPDLSDISSLPLKIADTGTVSKALKAATAGKAAPLEIGIAVPLRLTLADGRWDAPTPGVARWRSRVLSSGARSISFEFSRFELPAGGSLWVYDAAGTLVQGPYTAAQRLPDSALWTALVTGETAVLEVRVPSAQQSAVALELASISHNYAGLGKAGISGDSAGTCNIDVAASQGNNHRSELRSVAAYTVRVARGSGPACPTTSVSDCNLVCTGQLINNFRQDSTPYFLTANHCGVSANSAASMVLYWNFQRASCGSGNGDLSQTQSGTAFRAANANADFALVQLNSTPATAFNVFYGGFDAAGNAPQSGVSIHHPQGDVKKISLFTTASCAQTVDILGSNVDGWAVRWAQGTTEQGSSGGALLDQNRRIVGVLSGGDASCDNISGTDYFGRLARAWRATNNSNGQLKAWLDPDNSGRVSLCGQNPGSPCDASLRTTGSTSPGTVTAPPTGSAAAAALPNTACSGNAPAQPSPANAGGGIGCGPVASTPTPTPTPTPTTPPESSGGGAPGVLLLAGFAALLSARRAWRGRAAG